ncbi:MAG: class I fructose-bisphosphate aldolase [Steroidobacteraceae bacterium]
MSRSDLERVATAMVAKDKGLLAADESTTTIAKRLDKIGTQNTEEHRRSYRELLFTTPGIAQWISGVILYDETIRQKTRDGVPFPDYLVKLGIIPGIKVDTGAKPLAGFPDETITEGLDGLRDRLVGYYKLGARFAKWRAVIDIGDGLPTRAAIEANAQALARYAGLCQEQNIVPIVEPEVLMDGAHTAERCDEVTSAVLAEVFLQLERHRIHLEGMILKPNMIIAGKKCATQATPEQVAEGTVRCLRRHVPCAVPGIMFLSGGQTPAQAALHLSLMNRHGPLPWQLSFSYGRALQDAALTAWGGKPANFAAGQKEFQKWSRLNGLARSGGYQAGMEQQAA